MSVRILHLEDSSTDAALVEGTLAAAGMHCEITCVHDPDAFARHVTTNGFDLVISDNQLPRFDGLSALRLVRAQDPLLPFIFVSGTMGEEAAIRSLTSGATDYVLKGNLARLPAAIDRALDTTRERRQRLEAETALHESEARYRALVETAWDWVWAIDAAGTFTFSSQAGARISGYGSTELLGRNLNEVVHPDDVAAVHQALEQCVGAGAPVLGLALRCRHRDGSVRHLEANIIPIMDDERRLVGFTGSTRDVTERRELEMQLRQAQKLEALGGLAGGIAHDFNNLLATVTMCTDMLLPELPDDSPCRKDVESIQQAVGHGVTLTRQLLAFSRQQPIEPTLIDVAGLTDRLDQILRRLSGSDVSVVVRTEAGLSLIRADRGQLEQILLNLAVNARDAMPQGGTLTIETFAATVDEAQIGRHPDATIGPHVVIAVRDTGVGIDEATLARIFDPFFTTKAAGTGLGLSTVYGIVRQAGGHVRVETAPGHGTAFLVYLPAAQA